MRDLGASAVVDYKKDADWGGTIYSLAGNGVDHIIDVGGASTLMNSIAAARVGGNIVLIGMLGSIQAELNLVNVMLKQPRIRPIAVGSHAMQRRMLKAIDQLHLKPIIDRVFPLSEITDALKHQLSGKHLGKVVIDLSS